MPYVSDVLREIVDDDLQKVRDEIVRLAKLDEYSGLLNYCITELVVPLMKHKYGDRWRYEGVSDVVKTFECAKLEFYRRIGASYEDSCIARIGDVKAYE